MSKNRFEKLAAKSMGFDLAEETETVEQTENVEKTETVEQTETPKQEIVEESTEPQEKSSLTEKTTQETNEDSEVIQKSLDELLSEKTNGKYSTYEELESALSTQSTSSSFANEQIEKLNDYVAKGGNVDEFLRTQTANYDEMDETDIIKSHIKFNNQDLSNDEIDLLFKSKYKLDEDVHTPDEIKLSKIKIKSDSKKAKSELKKFQKDNAVPKQHREKVNNDKMTEASMKLWHDKIDESLSDFKSVDFDINDKGDKFSYSLNNEAVDNVKSSTKNLSSFWNRYVNKDGSENIAKLSKEMAVLENLDSIIRSAYAQGVSEGKGNVIEDIKNPSYTPDNSADTSKPLSIAQQIAAELRKNL
mgnify:CR=1 FL=1|tara:strand:+ start:1004 stop:2083 length:1080 start_codon:yes stop_codon:yes gene_type:complete